MRPHHSLCIQFFKGEGYSREFVISMTEIINFLNQNNPVVKLSVQCDVICQKCPNNIGRICLTEEKVSCIDRRCLEKLHLHFGDEIQWQDLKQLAFENIIKSGNLKDVCRECQWSGLCQ